jgi:hypothetical protein
MLESLAVAPARAQAPVAPPGLTSVDPFSGWDGYGPHEARP